MLKKVLQGMAALALLLVVLDLTGRAVFGQSLVEQLTRSYVTILFQNYATSALPTVGVKGRTAYDSTLNTLSVEDSARWQPVMTRYYARAASHVEITQATAPTVASCTGGSVDTGSTDSAGRVSGITGSTCYLTFNNYFTNPPFVVLSRSNTQGGTGVLRHIAFVSGIDIYAGLIGSAAGDAFSYVTIGRY